MQDFEEMTDEEIEKIRTTVVIKTYSSLIKKHRYATPEQVQLQLKAVSKFGRALFNNIRGPNTHRRAPCGAPSLHDASASVASPNPLPYVLPLPLFPSSLTSPPSPFSLSPALQGTTSPSRTSSCSSATTNVGAARPRERGPSSQTTLLPSSPVSR